MLNLQSRSRPSLLKILGAAILSLSSTAAFAVTPDQVIRRAEAIHEYVSDNAYRMSSTELRTLDLALSKISIRSPNPRQGPGQGQGQGPGPGSNPRPNPPYPNQNPNPYPPQSRVSCELLGRGAYANWTYAYRLSLGGQVMEGSDQLDTILSKIEQYRQDGACGVVVQGALTLAARGAYANWTYAYRVMLNGTAIAGSDDLEAALALMGKVEQAGAGRVEAARSSCQLLARGAYANWTYAFRVGVGSAVMMGTDSYETAMSTIQRLRSESICY